LKTLIQVMTCKIRLKYFYVVIVLLNSSISVSQTYSLAANDLENSLNYEFGRISLKILDSLKV
jgi:hypothetical protein